MFMSMTLLQQLLHNCYCITAFKTMAQDLQNIIISKFLQQYENHMTALAPGSYIVAKVAHVSCVCDFRNAVQKIANILSLTPMFAQQLQDVSKTLHKKFQKIMKNMLPLQTYQSYKWIASQYRCKFDGRKTSQHNWTSQFGNLFYEWA